MSSNPVPVYNLNTKVNSKKKGNLWWKKDKPYGEIQAAIQSISNNQVLRRDNLIRYARLYTNKDLASFLPGSISPYSDRRLSFNVVKSCIDTAHAKIAKNKIRPLVLTEQGDFSQQRKAQFLTQYIHGAFEKAQAYDKMKKAQLHSCVYDIGAVKVYKDTNKNTVECEVIHPHELFIDEVEAIDGTPRSVFQVRLVARSLLLEAYAQAPKETVAAIERAQPFVIDGYERAANSDLVSVMEAWHLPSGKTEDPEKTDGRHCICIEGAMLFDEKYAKDHFPIVFLRWNEAPFGFFGEGIASQLVGIQIDINTTLQRIKESQETYAIPRIFLETSSQIQPSQITDEIGSITYYAGTPPVFSNPIAANPEIYSHLENLVQKAYQMTGISEMSARSLKPAGLESGVALRTFQDIETERFAITALGWQDSHVELAKLFVELSREIYSEDKKLSVVVKGKDFIKKIKWSEVDMDEDAFVLSVYPTSTLPDRPEGRLAQVQDWWMSGFITKDEAFDLLDFPDLKAFTNLKKASLDDLRYIMEEMLKRNYIAPEPLMDLNQGIKMFQSFWLRSRSEGVPDDIRLMAAQWVSDAQALLQQGQQEAVQQEAAMQTATQPPQMPPAATPAMPVAA